jgi:hypothetical protein
MTIPNQAKDSSQAGYLQPNPTAPTAPLDGQALENYLQQFVAGVASLDSTLVRPRWQPEPPTIPDFDVTWVAVGTTRKKPIGLYGAVIHNPADPGSDLMQRHEDIDVLCSFYGPEAEAYANNLSNGVMVDQNRAELRRVGLAFVEISQGVRIPELIKNQWLDRVDKMIYLRRIVQRVYPILNVLESQGTVKPDPDHGYRAPWDAKSPE